MLHKSSFSRIDFSKTNSKELLGFKGLLVSIMNNAFGKFYGNRLNAAGRGCERRWLEQLPRESYIVLHPIQGESPRFGIRYLLPR